MADSKKYLSKIVKGSDTLWLKDSEARDLIADIQSSITGSMHFLGTSTTALSDGLEMVDSNPGEGQIVEVTIAGVKYRKAAPGSGDDWKQLKSGDVAVYATGSKDMEFVYNDVTHKWQEYGSTGSLKALAFKDNASATYTPAGTNQASAVTFTGQTDANFVTGYNNDAVAPSFSEGAFTPASLSEGFYSAGTAPSFSEGAFSAGSLPTFTEGAFTPASISEGFVTAGTAASYSHSGFDGGSLGSATTGNFNTDAEKSSYDENSETLTLSAATTAAAVTAQGTFTPATYGTDTFNGGTPTAIDTTKFSGGSKAADTFTQGSLPSKAADTWSAGTMAAIDVTKFNGGSKAADTFSAGSAATLATSKAITAVGTGEAAAQVFSGTEATITVS